jgi:hypothetical protein
VRLARLQQRRRLELDMQAPGESGARNAPYTGWLFGDMGHVSRRDGRAERDAHCRKCLRG